jgi:hypothetical protein
MESLRSNISAVLADTHTSTWAFCSAIEESAKCAEEGKPAQMLAQGLREWASYRNSARKEYESIIRSAQDQIQNIDENRSIYFSCNHDRVNEYNAKAETQLEIVRTVAYIIGLTGEQLQSLFAVVTKLEFKK